jgi:hypothetical protein
MKNNNNILPAILAIGLILVSLFVAYQLKNDSENTISVTGSYQTDVDPDQVEITFRVLSDASTAETAAKLNSDKANNLVNALKNAGLEEKDIQTISYYSNKNTVWENDRYVDKGYQVVNSMKITSKQIKRIGNLIDVAISNGAEGIDSLAFTLSEEKKEEIYQDAFGKAGDNARERADKMAESIGFKIKGVKTVSLNNPYTPYYAYDTLSYPKEAAVSATPIQPQSVNIDISVNVVYEIA